MHKELAATFIIFTKSFRHGGEPLRLSKILALLCHILRPEEAFYKR